MKTSLARKIIFTIIGLLIFAYVILLVMSFGHGSSNKELILNVFSLFLSGIICISLGYIKLKTLWYIFSFSLLIPSLSFGMLSVSTGIFPPLAYLVLQFGILLLLIVLTTYLIGIYKELLTVNKEIILVVLLLLLPMSFYFHGFLNGEAVHYAYNTKAINFILPPSFSSMDQCKSRHVLEEAGFCYGYFANLNNDVNLCNEYIDKNVDPLLNKNYIYVNCVTGFSVYKNDPSFCKDLGDEGFQSKCLFHYFVAKKEFNKCQTIKYKPFESFSYSGDKCLEYNSPWYVKKYAEIVYSELLK
mgnify:CR=1 FL=1